MRRIVGAILAALFVVTPLTSFAALTDNIAGYWKLDESSGDASDATGNAQTLTNNNSVSYAAGLINNAADFGTSNTNKYLSRSSEVGGINGGSFTMQAWVKLRTEIPSDVYTFIVNASGANTSHTRYSIRYNYNSGTRRLEFARAKPGNGADDELDYNITLGTSSFYHLVMTYNGTTITGYVNGNSVGTAGASGNGTINFGSYFEIGCNGDSATCGSTNAASAYIDESAVWSRALSSTEVTQLYRCGLGSAYSFSNTVCPAAAGGSVGLTSVIWFY